MPPMMFDRRGRDAIRAFIVMDLYFTSAGLLALFVSRATFVDDNVVFTLVPFLGLLLVSLVIAYKVVTNDGPLLVAMGLNIVGNWMMALVVSIVVPFLWPAMTLVVLMPVVLATPYLGRGQLLFTIICSAIFTGLVSLVGMLDRDWLVLTGVSHDLEIIIVTGIVVALVVPIGTIVWQNNRLQQLNLVEVIDLNTRLLRAQEDLAASRRRVLEAGDIERRRIERDLHDGAQQRLLALGVRLRLLEQQTQDQPELNRSIEALIGELDAGVEEVRELARGIYPPMLEAWGLPEALSAVALRSTIPVHVTFEDIGRLSRPTETALYFTAIEALTNAAKHAQNSSARLSLVRIGGTVVLTVVDDGPGFLVEQTFGTNGVGKLGDRIGAVGGTLEVTSEPGVGTSLTAVVPYEPAVAADG